MGSAFVVVLLLSLSLVATATEDTEASRVITGWQGSRTDGGTSFAHMERMTEIADGQERDVFVYALGNEHTFKCAVLPATDENRELFLSARDIPPHRWEDFIADIIEESDDVIRGTTDSVKDNEENGARIKHFGTVTEMRGSEATGEWTFGVRYPGCPRAPERPSGLHIVVESWRGDSPP